MKPIETIPLERFGEIGSRMAGGDAAVLLADPVPEDADHETAHENVWRRR